ncbi:MAG: exosortase [Methyloprofundus sp.]|nr:MAG: exosortase [Methyloprofundus sp.]
MDINYKNKMVFVISIMISVCLLIVVFYDGLAHMVSKWNSDEYSHGYFIPLISLWMTWENREKLATIAEYSWAGPCFVLVGLALGIIGELATLFVITQYAFLLTLFGLCLSFVGWQGVRLLWFPLAYLLFMIPLPNFLYNNLSSYLQLISSSLGVSVIRFCDISVFLQGNVIDLGNYQLQVVEACSGLRYLFPLASFGFLCAYFFKGKWWMRAFLFLSTLPITMLMNSFRIGVIGVLVENWGIEQAEGFLHDFEGWVIFIGCLGVLFFEMWLLVKLFYKGQSFADIFVIGVDEYSGKQNIAQVQQEQRKGNLPKPYIASLILLVLVTPLSILVGDRAEVTPDRTRFNHFPLQFADWRGAETKMEQQFIDALKFDDYITANYSRPGDASPINFYVAYYASQRKGASVHSPKSCMPGDGWRISGSQQKKIAGVVSATGQPLLVNRVIISKGERKQLVYYWFQQRGRVMTNEYMVKWYLFWDALTRSRTDGALVRLVMTVSDGDSVAAAEQQLDAYLAEVFPVLSQFVPD